MFAFLSGVIISGAIMGGIIIGFCKLVGGGGGKYTGVQVDYNRKTSMIDKPLTKKDIQNFYKNTR